MSILEHLGLGRKTKPIAAEVALPGRPQSAFQQDIHYVLKTPIVPPFAEDMQIAQFGLGCFWGAEKQFWPLPGVYTTAVGYSAGFTPYPTYEEVCSAMTGHNEVVQVVFDPTIINYVGLLKVFFEAHDPTQHMRQGNDIGTQYRSGIYVMDDIQQQEALAVLKRYQAALNQHNRSEIATEVIASTEFYFAEPYHQQYLAKNPGGYCGLNGTGVCLPENQ